MTRRLEHHVQHHRTVTGSVVILERTETAANPPPWAVIRSCSTSEHSPPGIAATSLGGLLRGVSSRCGVPEHPAPSRPDSPQASGSASTPAAQGPGCSKVSCSHSPNPLPSTGGPAAAFLPGRRQNGSRGTHADLGTARASALETAAIRRLSTHAASWKCGHFREGFLSSCTLHPVDRLACPRACYSTGKRKPRRGIELNDWKILCSEGNEDYSKGLCSASMSVLPRKCKALLPPPLGWSTKEPQSQGAATRSHEKPAEGGDGGPRAPSKYQMALGICKRNEREGTNGTQACCVFMSCLLFFFFSGFV